MTSFDIARKLYHSQPFWTIFAVVTGFCLAEGSAWVRYRLRIRRLKVVVREELRSIAFQIDQKKDIVAQALAHLSTKKVLPTRSIRIIAAGYTNNITELYPYLSAKERNSLHVIYERLKISDEMLNSFDRDIFSEIKEKIMAEPFKVFTGRLNDVDASYDMVKKLIKAYLDGEPEDVFYLEDKGGF